jgi:hypothetical protein
MKGQDTSLFFVYGWRGSQGPYYVTNETTEDGAIAAGEAAFRRYRPRGSSQRERQPHDLEEGTVIADGLALLSHGRCSFRRRTGDYDWQRR